MIQTTHWIGFKLALSRACSQVCMQSSASKLIDSSSGPVVVCNGLFKHVCGCVNAKTEEMHTEDRRVGGNIEKAKLGRPIGGKKGADGAGEGLSGLAAARMTTGGPDPSFASRQRKQEPDQ